MKRKLKCPTCKKILNPTEPNGHIYKNICIGKPIFTIYCSILCREKGEAKPKSMTGEK